MSENVSATELTSQYSAQVHADLERNTKEQHRIGAEIAALQEQLAAHQRDHAVLVSIQQALDAAPAPVEPAVLPERAAVPAPRDAGKKTSGSGAGKRTQGKKAASQPRRDTAGKTNAGKTSAGKPSAGKASAGKTAGEKAASGKGAGKAESGKTAQPTLVELIRGHLAEQSEPRSAAEIATALGQAHPERSVKTTVVRTTLEGLVAKSQAQRSKQGSSVFYTAGAAVSEQAAPAQAEQQEREREQGQGQEQPASAGA
ncbi:hypothetical protein [Streptomyces sp. NPDC029674]|uniref:hypothetical protein n=1 Tax=Streptomyces sp. NPDC029674 TaxID=3365297 RepID=UPI003851114D